MSQSAPAPEDGAQHRLIGAVASVIGALPAGSVGVAVSGGGDSMALLHLAAQAAGQTGHRLRAVTLDHGLRAEAKAEAALVAQQAAALGIAHDILHWDGQRARGNPQAEARAARYRMIGEWARDHGCDAVMLGHTGDDVAETFLMRLARKAGLAGLAAMTSAFERDGMLWHRPLLRESRSALRAYLTEQGIDWAEDPSNDDPRFDRVRARAALKALGPVGLDAMTLGQSAQALRDAEAALVWATQRSARRCVAEDRGDVLITWPVQDDVLPAEIRRRILSAALQWVGRGAYAPRASGLAELCAALETAGQHTLAGCLVRVENGPDGPRWRVMREAAAVAGTVAPLGAAWDGRWALDPAPGAEPKAKGLEIRALGTALKDCADWRSTGLPRASLLASPAVWHEDTLIAAPLADPSCGWTARIVAPFTVCALYH